MTCPACETKVEKVGGEVKGLTYIKANAEKKIAVVEYDKRRVDIQAIMEAINTSGYKAINAKEVNHTVPSCCRAELKSLDTKE